MTTSELIAQDEEAAHAKMQMRTMRKTEWPDGLDKKDGEKKKKKKKKKQMEHKTQKDKQKEEKESDTEPWVKKEEIGSATEWPHKKDGENKKKKRKKQKEHNTQKDEQKEEIESDAEPGVRKEEIESETETYVKKDEEKPKKKKAKLSEGIDGNNHKREPDSGKEKKKKKQKTEDSTESSSPITKEKKRKKTEKVHEGGAGLRENKEISSSPEKQSPEGSSKKVRFSEDVEIFPLVDDRSSGKTKEDDGLIRGKRFSKEEDEIVKKAVFEYIEKHALGDEGLKMVLHCREYPEVKSCWKDIGKAIPYRPYLSVYYRAHILFERDETRKWTPEEYEFVRKFHDEHGSDWKALADVLGKHRFHVKDTWRRIKLPNMKKGQWTQDEYQKLFDLVNKDLRLKASEEKRSKHGMLRDNICWGAISDVLSTRSTALCCQKWYRQLTSPMVAENEWADVDDYRLVDALSSLDACSIEDVEWDQLLEHRDGDVCRKRWSQMIKHIGDNGNKSFSEQVEILSMRYSIDVLDAREAYDNAPVVD
ncbi:RNA polymerase I termination factor [Cucumis melo var. makuwa]|uniref:RNA polymerase I termination factor n=1 Tax=Cucumis melo var. makuwa TaxID=1194695 RepID=A0A5D3D3K4_CUCMM|nr:RNA polymerase I termination factor [Cucumis melo var. makuwa]